MIEWLIRIGAIFNPIGFALTALALYYAISTARKVSRDMKIVQENMESLGKRMEDMQKSLEQLSDKSDVSDYTLRLTSPFPEPFVSVCERIAVQHGFMEVRGAPFHRYGITLKGKELLNQLYPANQLQHFEL